MKIYFHSNPNSSLTRKEKVAKMIGILRSSGVLVIDNTNPESRISSEMERAAASGQFFLSQIDALILEGSYPTPESGHLVALAITFKKPILYLIEQGKAIDKNLAELQENTEVAKILKIARYTQSNIENLLTDFLSSCEQGENTQLPNIKFTLRITKRIERYLNWKAQKTKITKADFLRETIEKMIEDEEGYGSSNLSE